MTLSDFDQAMRDFFPKPGERIKQYVVDYRREAAWERETCPRIAMPAHQDNTGAECRNSGTQAPWVDLSHDCCHRCCYMHDHTRELVHARGWFAERDARPRIETDRTKLSDEIAPDYALAPNPLLAMITKDKAP